MSDSLYEKRVEKPFTYMLFAMAAAFSPHPEMSDRDTSMTFFTRYKYPSAFFAKGIDLPLKISGETDSLAWDILWIDLNDVTKKFLNRYSSGENPFEETKVYFDCAEQDGLNYHLQSRTFDQVLTSKGVPHNYVEYSGYGHYPAGHSNFLYDRLEEILLFHSENFAAPDNKAPVLDSIGAKTVKVANTLTFRVAASDPEGDPIKLIAEDLPTHAAFVDSGNGAGAFSFTPDSTQLGTHDVKFIASDGELLDQEVVEITVKK